jgi:DNA-binding NarL/FixJ family response regulator
MLKHFVHSKQVLQGYLLKSAIADDVAHAIMRVSQGRKYVPSEVAISLADSAVDA